MIICINDAVAKSTKLTKVKTKFRFELCPWINKNLQNLILYKRKLLTKRRKYTDTKINDLLKRISKIIKIANKLARNDYYYDNLNRVGGDTKKCWKFLNNILGREPKSNVNLTTSAGTVIVDDQVKANELNHYFVESVKDLRSHIPVYPGDDCNKLRTLPRSSHKFSFEAATIEDLEIVIDNLDIKKSTGYDGISPKLVVKCKEIILPMLLNIFNKIISSGSFPDCLKISKIVPIPKVPNASTVNKYRPVALLSIIDKIFEKLIYQQLLLYIENNNFIYKHQFGFKKGCGTEEAVVNVVNDICNGLDTGSNGVAGLFLDFSKAFDLVDHNIMLQKLKFYGVDDVELEMFESYLKNRKQYVEINQIKSDIKNVECGVPQGSCLGPLLFSVYLNDISNLDLTGHLYMFADDVCLFYPYKYDLSLKANMERDISLIFEFARLNKLVLNADKTKLIRFRPHAVNTNFNIYVDGNIINETDSVKYLGITLQSNLAWDLHIRELKSKIAPAIGILYKMKYKLNANTKLLLYQALIQSHLNYMAIIYGFKSTTILKSLQCMQNKSLKAVYNLPIRFQTLSLFRDICKSNLPIHGLYKYQVLMYIFKSLHNIGYRTVRFNQNQVIFYTRNQQNLWTPRCRLETSKQRIQYMGAVEYNNLPVILKTCNRISTFKNLLKEYLAENLETLLM